MMMANRAQPRRSMLLAGFFASSIVFFSPLATSAQEREVPTAADKAVTSPAFPSTPAVAPLASISRTVNSNRAAAMYRRL